MNRDITHLSSDFIKSLYSFRLSDDQKQKVHELFSQTFEGTKTYHNYTKDMKPEQMAARRYMMELKANDYMYVNQKTFEVTNSDDPEALEFVHFFLKG